MGWQMCQEGIIGVWWPVLFVYDHITPKATSIRPPWLPQQFVFKTMHVGNRKYFSWPCANPLRCFHMFVEDLQPQKSHSQRSFCSFQIQDPSITLPGGWFLLGGTMAARQLVAWWDDHKTPFARFDAWICFNWRGWYDEVTNQPGRPMRFCLLMHVWRWVLGSLLVQIHKLTYIDVYCRLAGCFAFVSFSKLYIISSIEWPCSPSPFSVQQLHSNCKQFLWKGVAQNRCSQMFSL